MSIGPAAAGPGPVLVIGPEHDQFCPPGRARALVDRWSNAEFVMLEGADHFMGNGTTALVELVTSFVERVAGR